MLARVRLVRIYEYIDIEAELPTKRKLRRYIEGVTSGTGAARGGRQDVCFDETSRSSLDNAIGVGAGYM